MAMVVGNEDYDWNVLEFNCEYRNGYTANDETVSNNIIYFFLFYCQISLNIYIYDNLIKYFIYI